VIRRSKRDAERGTAILITMLLTVALLAGGAVLIGMQLTSTKTTDVARLNKSSLYCAEAGLVAARAAVAANYPAWGAALCNPPPPRGTGTCVIGSPAAEPIFLQHPAVNHDIDGDGAQDFVLTLVDNDDEPGSGANDLSVDVDLQIFVTSTCIKFPDIRRQVSELVKHNAVVPCHKAQAGGCDGGGNGVQSQ
jgi:hypothetical protein